MGNYCLALASHNFYLSRRKKKTAAAISTNTATILPPTPPAMAPVLFFPPLLLEALVPKLEVPVPGIELAVGEPAAFYEQMDFNCLISSPIVPWIASASWKKSAS